MARAKTTSEPIDKALNSMEQPERFKLGEISTSGLRIFSGVPSEELNRELDFPNNIKTYKQMSYHPAINSCTTLYSSMISKARFRVLPPKDFTKKEEKVAEIVRQMLFEDMETPFDETVQDALSMTVYGFSVLEKVYRKRNKSSGSLFNDGYIAPKKLAIRQQSSIDKFIFSDDGNSVDGVKQTIYSDALNRYSSRSNTIVIPRSKFLLFTAGGSNDNPYGVSPLRNVYLPWKYLSALEELEAQGVQKELHGVPVLEVPAQYMSSEASADQKAIYEYMKNMVRNLQQGSQAGVVLPSTTDPETREKLFSLDLLSTDGKKAYDINAIKDYYRSMIFIGMSSDILLMGNTNTGSFALGSIKNSLTGNIIEKYLKRILYVINNDLIRQIYELNGWDVSRMCRVDYEDVSEDSLEEISKFIQRCGATGYLPKDLPTVNFLLSRLGLDPYPEGTDVKEILPESTTRSGDSLDTASGGLNGTSESVSQEDTSSLNQDNAA